MQRRPARAAYTFADAHVNLALPVGGVPVGATTTMMPPARRASEATVCTLPDVPLPRLPDDCVRVITAFLAKTRRCAQFGAGGVVIDDNDADCAAAKSYHRRVGAYRLVCRAWARITGMYVQKLHVPRWLWFGAGPVTTAFPRVCRLDVPAWDVPNYVATISNVVATYRQDGRIFLIAIEEDVLESRIPPLNAHGAYVTHGRVGTIAKMFGTSMLTGGAIGSANPEWETEIVEWRHGKLVAFLDNVITYRTLTYILAHPITVYIKKIVIDGDPTITTPLRATELIVSTVDYDTVNTLHALMRPEHWYNKKLPKISFSVVGNFDEVLCIEHQIKRRFPDAIADYAIVHDDSVTSYRSSFTYGIQND